MFSKSGSTVRAPTGIWVPGICLHQHQRRGRAWHSQSDENDSRWGPGQARCNSRAKRLLRRCGGNGGCWQCVLAEAQVGWMCPIRVAQRSQGCACRQTDQRYRKSRTGGGGAARIQCDATAWGSRRRPDGPRRAFHPKLRRPMEQAASLARTGHCRRAGNLQRGGRIGNCGRWVDDQDRRWIAVGPLRAHDRYNQGRPNSGHVVAAWGRRGQAR